MSDYIRIEESVFEELAIGETVQIGSQKILIEPLTLKEVIRLSVRFREIFRKISERKINFRDWRNPEVLIEIAEFTIADLPEVLQEASRIHIDHLRKLPIAILLDIVTACISVNAQSNTALMGNLDRLFTVINMILPEEKEEKAK